MLDFSFKRSCKQYKNQFSGLAFSFGCSFQVTLDAFGYKFFGGYSSYQSHSSRFSDRSITSVPSIASDRYLTYCAIRFRVSSLMVALVNPKILLPLKDVNSITIWWHVALLGTNIFLPNEPVGVSNRMYWTVLWRTLIQQLQFSRDIERTPHFTTHRQKTLFWHPNSVCP